MSMVTFSDNRETKIAILNSFGFGVNESGTIVDVHLKCPARTPDGLTVTIDDFAGIWPGSRIIIKDDVNSLLNLTKKVE